jgi:uncharacterized protein YraI
MNRFLKLAGAALFAATLLPAAASAAAPGYVTTNLNVRAGPGTQFPAVAVFPAGSQLTVIGCTQNFGWCDVSGRGVRGWVSGAYLEILHERRRVRPRHGVTYGLPVITFSIGRYWDDHYRGRGWYRDRSRYERSWRDDSRRGDSWRGDSWRGDSWRGDSWRGDSWRDDSRRGDSWRDDTRRYDTRREYIRQNESPEPLRDITPQREPLQVAPPPPAPQPVAQPVVVQPDRGERWRERDEGETRERRREWDGERSGERTGERWR